MSVSSRAAVVALVGALIAGCGDRAGTGPVPTTSTLAHSPRSIGAGSAVAAGSDSTSGTLYASEERVVHAYPLGSDGTTTAVRSITPHPAQDQYIVGLAVNADGTLDLLEQFYAGGAETATSGYCRVVVESATASGSPPAVGTYLCDSSPTVASEGIAANTFGGYDVAFSDMQNTYLIRRFGSDGATVINTLNAYTAYLATDRGGHDYLSTFDGTNARVQSYKSTTTDRLQTQWDVTFIGRSFAQIAVSPQADRTVYIASGGQGGGINVLAPGATSISATIGPFPNFTISAMAVDAAGSLYVAMWPVSGTSGSVIRVYAKGTTGKPTPQRIIHPDPPIVSGPITGLAIAQ